MSFSIYCFFHPWKSAFPIPGNRLIVKIYQAENKNANMRRKIGKKSLNVKKRIACSS